MKKLADDCFLHDRDRMRHEEAISLLKSRIHPIVKSEVIPLSDASRRILAEDIKAPRNIPAFDNSAVDGFAFSYDDFEPTGGYFPISKRIAAGDPAPEAIEGFSAARIFTGAKMPTGTDTVAMQEDCTFEEQNGKPYVAIPSGLKKGANCRLAGEDVKSGDTIAHSSERIGPAQLAAIASSGIGTVKAFKTLKIGLLSSGNEILRPGTQYETGKVYDANHFMLAGLMDNPCFEVTDLGICPDDKTKLKNLLKDESKRHDVIISTGGASKGEEDHFVSAVEELGKSHLWQLAIKPGRPMSFGQIGSTPCFTLPGNPVAAFVCFLLYVKPALTCLAGGEWPYPMRVAMPAGFSIHSKPDRREFLRGYLERSDNGELVIQKFNRDGSGLISGLRKAQGLIEIPEEMTKVESGDQVIFLPFSGMIGD